MALQNYKVIYLGKKKANEFVLRRSLGIFVDQDEDTKRGLCIRMGWILLICKNSSFSTFTYSPPSLFSLVANLSRKKKLNLLPE